MTAVRNVMALVEKEWRHYFASPIAYVTLAVWTLLFGIVFNLLISRFLQLSVRTMGRGMGSPPPLSLNDEVITFLLGWFGFWVVPILMPMITMRLFAEEKRQGTIELLATSPLTNLQIVLGKFLAALGLYVVMILVGMLNFALLWLYADSNPEWKPLVSGVLGLLLVGACFIALGEFISSLSKSQIVAGILSFCAFFGINVLVALGDPTAGSVMNGFAYLSVASHFEDLAKGIVDLKDIVYYLSFITFGLFLTHQSVESQRWRA